MGIWQRIKTGMARFMEGRNGPDQLTQCLIWVGLGCYVISWITGLLPLSLAGFLLYAWSLFRMFSRNRVKRFAENQKYLNLRGKIRTETSQFIRRLKNMKQYKYLRCPQCRARLRLPRKVGTVTVRCGKCGNSFEAKA